MKTKLYYLFLTVMYILPGWVERRNRMQISITEKEVNAIDFGFEQIRDALEGSSSEEYKQDAEEAMRSLGNILRKCHLAREKANDLNKAKRYIRSRNGWMPPTKLDKMARLFINKTKDNIYKKGY